MKKLMFLLVLSFLSVTAYSEESFPIDSITKKVIFTEVVTNGLSKVELFSNAKTWMTKAFMKDFTKVMMTDNESGKIIFTGISPITTFKDSRTTCECKCTFTIECKEGKYRYTITDIYYFFISGFIPFENKINVHFNVNKKFNNLLNVDVSTLNNEELKSHKKELEKYLKIKQEVNDTYSNQYDNFILLCNSLKTEMNKKSDF